MKNYGLIGESLSHSFSKQFFEEKFRKENILATYSNFELESIDEVKDLFDKGGLDGLNVTVPYKEAILPYLDQISDEAKEIGAVNTVVFENGKTIGYNTDAHGFHQSIKPFLMNTHHRAMILGTGGASKAVAYVLQKIGLDVIYISRNPTKEEHFEYNEINSFMLQAFGLIVNTTPVGTFPNVTDMPDLPTAFLSDRHLVIDLIYNPEKSELLTQAEKKGAVILNGSTMLKEQALMAYKIWTGTI